MLEVLRKYEDVETALDRYELCYVISVGELCVNEYPFAIVDLSCYQAVVVSGVPVAKEHTKVVWKEVGGLRWSSAVPIKEMLKYP